MADISITKSNISLDRGEEGKDDRGRVSVAYTLSGTPRLQSSIELSVQLPSGTIVKDYLTAELQAQKIAVDILDAAALFLRTETEK